MNRTQFAEAVQEAYKNQFGIDGEDDRVMNDRIIVYDIDDGTFSSQSSLTPVSDVEIYVLTLTEGMFGSDDEGLTGDAISEYIGDTDNELWDEVRQATLQEMAERIYGEVIGADHKPTANVVIGEIYDWLADGDDIARPLETLAVEYAEYAGI